MTDSQEEDSGGGLRRARAPGEEQWSGGTHQVILDCELNTGGVVPHVPLRMFPHAGHCAALPLYIRSTLPFFSAIGDGLLVNPESNSPTLPGGKM